jgi:lincosamide nucleotidyltransferase A/C/D/E
MDAGDVVEILDRLVQARIDAWVDGGWGVDALLGTQTRRHSDLDLAIREGDIERATAALSGFAHDLNAKPGLPDRFVLMDARRRIVDIHPLTTEAPRYSADDLAGTGVIGGRAVRCLSARAQVANHSGYTNHSPDAIDYRDMRALAERFGVALPPEYAQAPGWSHPRRRAIGEI